MKPEDDEQGQGSAPALPHLEQHPGGRGRGGLTAGAVSHLSKSDRPVTPHLIITQRHTTAPPRGTSEEDRRFHR